VFQGASVMAKGLGPLGLACHLPPRLPWLLGKKGVRYIGTVGLFLLTDRDIMPEL